MHKLQARNHKFHQEKLAQMRASVDNRAPPRFKHLYVNAKKAQVEEDRLTEIEHQNRLLLHKLSRIAERRGVTVSSLEKHSTNTFSPADTAWLKALLPRTIINNTP